MFTPKRLHEAKHFALQLAKRGGVHKLSDKVSIISWDLHYLCLEFYLPESDDE